MYNIDMFKDCGDLENNILQHYNMFENPRRERKKQFMSLLLLADEQESMVDRYLEKGIIFFIQSPFLRFVMLYAAIIKEQVDIDFVHLEIA